MTRSEAEAMFDVDGVLRIRGWICVPKVGDLIKLIPEECHCAKYSIHLGATKMYHDLSQHYWRHGMKKNIAEFMSKCLECL